MWPRLKSALHVVHGGNRFDELLGNGRSGRLAKDVPVRSDINPIAGGQVLVVLILGAIPVSVIVEISVGRPAVLLRGERSQEFTVLAPLPYHCNLVRIANPGLA